MEKAMEHASKYSLPVREESRTRTLEPGESCDRYLALLRGFYKLMPERPSIDPTFVPPETIPQPQRSLLVHYSDMTSTLSRHYGEAIVLRPLDRLEGPQWYRRHIVLETAASRR